MVILVSGHHAACIMTIYIYKNTKNKSPVDLILMSAGYFITPAHPESIMETCISIVLSLFESVDEILRCDYLNKTI